MSESRTREAAVPPGPEIERLADRLVAGLFPARDPRAHKGTHGRLLIVAGSLDYAGAALLVAFAAGRAGAGLLRLAVPASLQPLFAGRMLEATTLAIPETSTPGEIDAGRAVAHLLSVEHDALVLGPGLRPGPATVEVVIRLLAGREGDGAGLPPALVDAEAVNSLSQVDRWWQRRLRPCVLTPHVGEFRRAWPQAGATDLVRDDEARAAAAREAAANWGHVVVLKGARTVVAAPDGRAAEAPFENAALASGGTGDVLSGTIGSLLAQGLAPYDAARAGVYLHGLAGEAVRDRFGDAGLLASDLPDEVARARHRLGRLRDHRGGRVGFAMDHDGRGAEPHRRA
jgi:ADP-dependent NAD(P)H-hydrate dehydratase / NAD(P)H-hydrate epimerase